MPLRVIYYSKHPSPELHYSTDHLPWTTRALKPDIRGLVVMDFEGGLVEFAVRLEGDLWDNCDEFYTRVGYRKDKNYLVEGSGEYWLIDHDVFAITKPLQVKQIPMALYLQLDHQQQHTPQLHSLNKLWLTHLSHNNLLTTFSGNSNPCPKPIALSRHKTIVEEWEYQFIIEQKEGMFKVAFVKSVEAAAAVQADLVLEGGKGGVGLGTGLEGVDGLVWWLLREYCGVEQWPEWL